ncbi:hypothetical protein SAMN04489731_113217 [Amycolatopsis regifaucium]|nr:hypothetical protein SAMN04489731_113217 [Amycolatopsis regifaucium]
MLGIALTGSVKASMPTLKVGKGPFATAVYGAYF